ncbi:hypothetical protein HK096_001650, partial [Nowakowskiella sp. JEL0078]
MARHGLFTFRNNPKGEKEMFRYLKEKTDEQLLKKVKEYEDESKIQDNERDWGYWRYKTLLDAFCECESSNASGESTSSLNASPRKNILHIRYFYANILNWRSSVYIGKKRLINDSYQYLSPTETAIFYQNVKILDHIKENLWEFGPTQCFMIPLNYLYIPNELCGMGIAAINQDLDTISHPYFRMILQVL